MKQVSVFAVLMIATLLAGCLVPGKKPEDVLLINCGSGNDYFATDGRFWEADRPFSSLNSWGCVGGDVFVQWPPSEIENTEDDELYLSERYNMTAYRIPLPNGNYKVKLHFAEKYDAIYGPDERIFSVFIEDQPVLTGFDLYKEAGKRNVAVTKTFPITVQDGELNITFEKVRQSPMVNGIEILK
jgi:hypothetical protein